MSKIKSDVIQKKAKWASYPLDDKIFLIIVYVTLALIGLACLYPMYFTVIASVSDANYVYTGKVSLWPKGFTLEAYELVFQNESIWLGYRNTILYTVAGTAFSLFLTIPAAYALSKKRMFGRGFFMTLFLITMYFGGGMIPTYLLMDKLKLINTRWIMILSGGLNVYNVVVARTYFQNNIPDTLFEAARIDGANEFSVFFKLVIPLSAPIIAVIALYSAVSHWSSYFEAMIYITNDKLQPLQIFLRRILILNEQMYDKVLANPNATSEQIEQAAKQAHMALTMKFSLVFIASAPMLIAYPFIQKYFVKGMMIGSLKG